MTPVTDLAVAVSSAAVAVTLVAVVVLAVCRGLASRPAPLRHGILCATIVVAILAVPSAIASRTLGWSLLVITPSPSRPACDEARFADLAADGGAGDSRAGTDEKAGDEPHGSIAKAATAPAGGRAFDADAPAKSAWHLAWRACVGLWATGAAVGVVLLCRDLLLLRRFRASLRPCADRAAASLLGEAARLVKLASTPRLCESAAARVPLVAGPVSPVVVLPAGLTRRMSREQLSAVFVHEAAHVAHGDLWIALAQRLAAILFWWCPPIHAVNRRLADLREEICDNHVLRAGDGAGGLALAEALVDLARGLPDGRRQLAAGMLGTIDERSGLVGRVERLLRPESRDTATRMTALALAATSIFGVASLAFVAATTLRAADVPAVDVSALTPREVAAIDAALEWIAARQEDDGGWSFDGQVGGRRVAATSLAVLPFLGRGHTHLDGPYKDRLAKGVRFIADRVTKGRGGVVADGGTMYSQGLATLVLCRAYALTKDDSLAGPAQAAIDFIVDAQDPVGGGWRYAPKQPGDTSVLGWQFAALASGKAAGLSIDPLTIAGMIRFLDGVQQADGTAYSYVTGFGASPTSACTAIGLLVRTRTGWKTDDERVSTGTKSMAGAGPKPDLYFDYHAARLMHAIGGDEAAAWREAMRTLLLERQVTEGDDRGSWFEGVEKTTMANRLYCTSLATLILEVPLAPPPE